MILEDEAPNILELANSRNRMYIQHRSQPYRTASNKHEGEMTARPQRQTFFINIRGLVHAELEPPRLRRVWGPKFHPTR